MRTRSPEQLRRIIARLVRRIGNNARPAATRLQHRPENGSEIK
jgi:hypothetical protein